MTADSRGQLRQAHALAAFADGAGLQTQVSGIFLRVRCLVPGIGRRLAIGRRPVKADIGQAPLVSAHSLCQ